jgi:hypothetical protein
MPQTRTVHSRAGEDHNRTRKVFSRELLGPPVRRLHDGAVIVSEATNLIGEPRMRTHRIVILALHASKRVGLGSIRHAV